MGLWGEAAHPSASLPRLGFCYPTLSLISAPGTLYHPQSLHTTALKDS